MGELGKQLSAASSAIGKGVGSVTNAVGFTPSPAPADNSDPMSLMPGYGDPNNPLSMLQAMGQSANGPAPVQQGPDMSQASPQQPAVVNNPYTPDDGSTVANPIAQPDNSAAPDASQPGITVTGDSWQPTHESLLARIGDLFFRNAFHNRIEEKDKEDLMQGFQADPTTAIARMRQIDPRAAWTMYNQYLENQDRGVTAKKNDAATNVLIDKAVLPQIGGMVQAIANETNPDKQEALWEKARPRILAVGNQYGRDYSDVFPEKFDPDTISLAIGQAINPARQQTIKQGDEKIVQGQEKIKQGQQRLNIQTEDVHSKEARRQAETQQGNERLTNHQNNQKSTSIIQTKYGPGIVKTVGNAKFLSVVQGGVQHVYTSSDGVHWQHYASKPLPTK
jgi:hypothetical protein